MEVKIVLGHAFGDEGKGVVVQSLCKEAIDKGLNPLVIRFSGGPQAAHTVKHNGIEHICSSYGSGVLLGVPTMIWNTAYFDPFSAKLEYDALKTKLGKVPPLFVHYKTPVITPYEVSAGRLNKKVLQDGTCGKGIYSTFKREKYDDIHLYAGDWNTDNIVYALEQYYHPENEHSDCELSPEGELFEKMRNKNYDFYSVVGEIAPYFYNVLILEGSQGLLLDMERGFFPNVTPSKVGLNGVPEESMLHNAELYLVTRTYLTRHGNGYDPITRGFNFNLKDKYETNWYNDYQGEFKTGIFNVDLLNTALTRHCIDNYINHYNINPNLVITHWDLLKQNKEFVCYYKNKIEHLEYSEPEELIPFFKNCFNIKYENVYVNDKIEGNLKKF